MNDLNKKKFLAHARIQAPREACGLIIIQDGKEGLLICKNKAEYDNQFILDPEDYANAEDIGEIVGVVHSHPNSSPQPSEADLVSCSKSNLKWHIVSTITGEWCEVLPSNYKAPLVGREWCHGSLDCYSLIRDYYKETLNIDLPDYGRKFEWWNSGDDLYIKNFKDAGFIEIQIEQMEKHDVILMQIQSDVVNHGAVYLGNENFLHHLHKRLSSRDVFGGFWLKNTSKILRHKDLFHAKD